MDTLGCRMISRLDIPQQNRSISLRQSHHYSVMLSRISCIYTELKECTSQVTDNHIRWSAQLKRIWQTVDLLPFNNGLYKDIFHRRCDFKVSSITGYQRKRVTNITMLFALSLFLCVLFPETRPLQFGIWMAIYTFSHIKSLTANNILIFISILSPHCWIPFFVM